WSARYGRRLVRVATHLSLALVSVTLLAACVAPTNTLGGEGAGPGVPPPTKRLVTSVYADPAGLDQQLTAGIAGSRVPGLAELYQLMNAALTYSDDQDVLQPNLAQAVPTAENGLWT